MRKSIALFIAILFACGLAACGAPVAGADKSLGEAIQSDGGITLKKISSHAWVFTSYYDYEGARTPANGMLIATSEGFVMVDTPWTDEQTGELLSLIDKNFGAKVVLAVFTHAHIDRIGGIKALQDKGIRAISTALTAEQAKKNGFAEPEIGITKDIQEFTVGGVKFETYYPGKAHSPDNITVWLPDDKVLFGGCMIKSMDSKNLGSIDDADLGNWPAAIDNVIKRYPGAAIVVPGHGAWGDAALLQHTAELCK